MVVSRYVALVKHRFQRSLTYVAWVQTPILALTLLNTLVLLGLEISVKVWGPILLFLMISGLLLLGFLDEKLGILGAEQEHASIQNPEFAALRAEVSEIKKMLKDQSKPE